MTNILLSFRHTKYSKIKVTVRPEQKRHLICPEIGTLALSDTDGKDQTYALYNLTQFQLEHTLMPLGSYE